METFAYRKQIPFSEEYDVVVCSGGPAGIGAAAVKCAADGITVRQHTRQHNGVPVSS